MRQWPPRLTLTQKQARRGISPNRPGHWPQHPQGPAAADRSHSLSTTAPPAATAFWPELRRPRGSGGQGRTPTMRGIRTCCTIDTSAAAPPQTITATPTAAVRVRRCSVQPDAGPAPRKTNTRLRRNGTVQAEAQAAPRRCREACWRPEFRHSSSFLSVHQPWPAYLHHDACMWKKRSSPVHEGQCIIS